MNQTKSYFLAFLSRFLLIGISVALVYVRRVMVVSQLWRKSDKRYTQLIKNIFDRFVFVCYTVQRQQNWFIKQKVASQVISM